MVISLNEDSGGRRGFNFKACRLPMKIWWREKAKYFLATQIPLTCLTAVVLFAIYNFESHKKESILKASEWHKLDHQQEVVTSVFKTVVSDLMFLSDQRALQLYFESGNPLYKKYIEQDWLSFSKQKGIYDQMRYIDASGMEVLRINYNNGNPSPVDEKLLQNKAKRYYFIDSVKLDKGDVYISPFDLNIEQNIIETPIKPMIRFGTPVFDLKGIKRGIVIINYIGEHLLNMLRKKIIESEGLPMLLNSDGYWLLGPEHEKEWGFMYDKDIVFGKDFPDAWKTISTQESGQFETAYGLFTFATIYPLAEGWKSSTGSPHAFEQSKRQFEAKSYYWKCLSFVPKKTSAGGINSLCKEFVIFFAVLFFATSILSLSRATVIIRRRQAEETISKLAAIVESSDDAIIGKTLDGIITSWNSGAERLYGYTKEEAVGRFISFLIPPGRLDESPMLLEKIVNGEHITHYETVRMKKDGSLIDVSLTLSPVKESAGLITGASAIARNITERKQMEAERGQLITDLQVALASVKQLSGLLPICASCKKIRDDKGYWNQIESYISEHSEVLFTHAICPECGKKLYPEHYDNVWGREDE